MKILAITNLFPNSLEPTRGVFNKQQFSELAKLCEVKVVAPIPRHRLTPIPAQETIDGIEVFHPRYFMTPKVGRSLYGLFFFVSLLGNVRKIYENFKFDLIFATWAYPDGFGSFLIAKSLGKPIVIKVHGSDINDHTKYLLRRKMIAYTLRNSDKVIAVTNALKERLVEIDVPEDKVVVIPNGVDTNLFKPMETEECRKILDLPVSAKIVLFVGNLVSVKGLGHLLDAFLQTANRIENSILVIVGDGHLQPRLTEKVKKLGLEEKVKFIDRQPHARIPLWMNACDVFCLPSLNEGCPNVVLEAFACGKPVVASRVGGLPEIINSEDIGILVDPMNPAALAQSLFRALDKTWDTNRIRHESLKYNWAEGAGRLKVLMEDSVNSFAKKEVKDLKKSLKSFAFSFIPGRVLLWRMRNDPKKIALTFDDGPNPKYTPYVLQILRERNAKATFFLIGKEVERNKELAKRIIDEGHSIGMHSYSHQRFGNLDLKSKKVEIAKSREILKEVLGVESNIFRPPQGSISFSQLIHCMRKKLTTVLWSIDSRDFENINTQHILDHVIENGIKGGDIILLHDDNQFTLQALPEIIENLQKRDFEFVTIKGMLQ